MNRLIPRAVPLLYTELAEFPIEIAHIEQTRPGFRCCCPMKKTLPQTGCWVGLKIDPADVKHMQADWIASFELYDPSVLCDLSKAESSAEFMEIRIWHNRVSNSPRYEIPLVKAGHRLLVDEVLCILSRLRVPA